MSLDDFWYGEEEMLEAYIKAYFNGTQYEAWINGYFTYIAQLTSTSNTWGGNSGKKAKYPQYAEIVNKEQTKAIETRNVPKVKDDNEFLSQFY